MIHLEANVSVPRSSTALAHQAALSVFLLSCASPKSRLLLFRPLSLKTAEGSDSRFRFRSTETLLPVGFQSTLLGTQFALTSVRNRYSIQQDNQVSILQLLQHRRIYTTESTVGTSVFNF